MKEQIQKSKTKSKRKPKKLSKKREEKEKRNENSQQLIFSQSQSQSIRSFAVNRPTDSQTSLVSSPSFRWREKDHPVYSKIQEQKNKNYIKHFMGSWIKNGFRCQQKRAFFARYKQYEGIKKQIENEVKRKKEEYKNSKEKEKKNIFNNIQAIANFLHINIKKKNEGGEKVESQGRKVESQGQKMYKEAMRRYADRSIRQVLVPCLLRNQKVMECKKRYLYSLLFSAHRTRNENLMLRVKVVNP